MTATHDDLPHPVPPIAFLRWKENWFLIMMDPERQVHGIVHCNHEPGHDRARYSCHLTVKGELYHYANESRFPQVWAHARSIGDERLRVEFVEPHARMDLSLTTAEVDVDVSFTKARPTFDFAACKFANPAAPSFQEIMTYGTNLPYNHQQQGMFVRGKVLVKMGANAGEYTISGFGYRDHSWCMRTDTAVASHTWSGWHFGDRVFGVKKLHTQARPEVWAREGYVSDADGERALGEIEVSYLGKSADGLPEKVRCEVTDVYGKRFTFVGDVAGRHGQVPLVSEKPGHGPAYRIAENFCPAVLEQTGQKGCALIEIGGYAL
jgi:hypothetical protein